MKTETLEITGKKYLIKISDEARENTAVSVRNNVITIKIPLALNREERFRQLLKMKSWAKQKIEKNPEKFAAEVQKEYKDGDILKIGEEEFILKIEFKEKQSSSAKIMGNNIHLVISSNLSPEHQRKHVSSLLSRCVAQKRLPQLQEKVHQLNQQHFNQQFNKIFFKNTSSRWGSCSKQGNINISSRLLFAPEHILESVCIHELAHLIEHNHSDHFWELVERAEPNHKEKRKWLNENGHQFVF